MQSLHLLVNLVGANDGAVSGTLMQISCFFMASTESSDLVNKASTSTLPVRRFTADAWRNRLSIRRKARSIRNIFLGILITLQAQVIVLYGRFLQ